MVTTRSYYLEGNKAGILMTLISYLFQYSDLHIRSSPRKYILNVVLAIPKHHNHERQEKLGNRVEKTEKTGN